MKRELFIHYSFLIAYFIFISLFRKWVSLSYLPFWLGGVVGTLLPELDHFIYIYFLRGHELTSQRVNYMLGKRRIKDSLDLLAQTRSERKDLIFHTAPFQFIFLIFTFFVITSSGSLFGRGLVLAFLLHLSVDQLIDLLETEGLDNWFRQLPFSLDKEKATFLWLAIFLIVLVFGFLF